MIDFIQTSTDEKCVVDDNIVMFAANIKDSDVWLQTLYMYW